LDIDYEVVPAACKYKKSQGIRFAPMKTIVADSQLQVDFNTQHLTGPEVEQRTSLLISKKGGIQMIGIGAARSIRKIYGGLADATQAARWI